MGGCGGPFRYPRDINAGDDRYVRLEARYGHGQDGESMRFAHPIVLSEMDWGRILNRLYVKPHRWVLSISATEATPSPFFNDKDRPYLAKYLAKAFANARPDEWVLFYLSHPRESGITEITSGGFFAEAGRIHLVIANYHSAVSMPFIQQLIWEDPLRPAGETFYDIVPQQYQTLSGDQRWDPTKLFAARIPELVIDYTASLILSGETSSKSDPSPFENGLGSDPATQLEKSLRTLERLREKGVITEEEYRLKRQGLLEKLKVF